MGHYMHTYGISANLIDGVTIKGSSLPEAVCRAIVLKEMGEVIS